MSLKCVVMDSFASVVVACNKLLIKLIKIHCYSHMKIIELRLSLNSALNLVIKD